MNGGSYSFDQNRAEPEGSGICIPETHNVTHNGASEARADVILPITILLAYHLH